MVKLCTCFYKTLIHIIYCGKTGIRTLGTVARSPHFECGPIDHSGISPYNAPRSVARCRKRFWAILRCKDINSFLDCVGLTLKNAVLVDFFVVMPCVLSVFSYLFAIFVQERYNFYTVFRSILQLRLIKTVEL